MSSTIRLFLCAVLLSGCAILLGKPLPGAEAAALISPNAMLEHVRILASDDFEGRAPGTRGETLTLAYLVKTLQGFGLTSGVEDGTFLQPVKLAAATVAQAELLLQACGRRQVLQVPVDAWVMGLAHDQELLLVRESPVIFAGYGVSAPEFGWDDFKGLDLGGATLLELPNDPQVADAKDPAKLDLAMFNGPGVTRYALMEQKLTAAAATRARGRLTLFEDSPFAARAWSGRQSFVRGEDLTLPGRAPLEFTGELGAPATTALLQACGLELGALKKAANRRDFRPVRLDATLSLELHLHRRELITYNVIARLEGSDPLLKDEAVLFTAHWDHLGRDPMLSGDQIYNGARDNAAGVAALLEIARAFAALPTHPRRTVLFLFTTAEEHGLLGARSYALHPVVPLSSTKAEFNVDMINTSGPTHELGVIGFGPTELSDQLTELAALQGRKVVVGVGQGDAMFYRSDQLVFAEAGVPVLFLSPGRQRVEDGRPRLLRDTNSQRYHDVSDEIDANWDLSGAAQDHRLLFSLAYTVAQDPRPIPSAPRWWEW